MDKADLKEIKTIIDSALETHLASVHDEISDLRNDMDIKLNELEGRLTAKIVMWTRSSEILRTGKLISGCSLRSASEELSSM
jgi:hypothetical protein